MSGAPAATQALASSDATTLQRRLADARLDWIVPDWPAPRNVNAFTTTRRRGDTERLADFVPSPPVLLKQVHGAGVAVLDARTLATARATPLAADAAVTRLRGVVCAIATADCLPVVLADRGGEIVGVAHAGWRGLAAGVLENTVDALVQMGARVEDVVAWFGPAIGPRAFEVGGDVFDAFCTSDREAQAHFVPRDGKWLADLYGLARHRLASRGVHEATGGGWCTFSEPARFFSYRREKSAGRMLTLAWLAQSGNDLD